VSGSVNRIARTPYSSKTAGRKNLRNLCGGGTGFPVALGGITSCLGGKGQKKPTRTWKEESVLTKKRTHVHYGKPNNKNQGNSEGNRTSVSSAKMGGEVSAQLKPEEKKKSLLSRSTCYENNAKKKKKSFTPLGLSKRISETYLAKKEDYTNKHRRSGLLQKKKKTGEFKEKKKHSFREKTQLAAAPTLLPGGGKKGGRKETK